MATQRCKGPSFTALSLVGRLVSVVYTASKMLLYGNPSHNFSIFG